MLDALVIGADSMIGAALLEDLEKSGLDATGTTRRGGAANRLFLDLTAPSRDWDLPAARVAYLCAAVARLEDCRNNPALAQAVNVDGIARLARALTERGSFVVFLSSDKVFDGSRPLRRTYEATCPTTEYGRQKALAETHVRELPASQWAIARLTKVVQTPHALFEQWVQEMRAGQTVHPFSDMTFAPVPLQGVVSVLRRIGDLCRPGLFHISGEEDMTYAQAARLLAEALGLNPEQVRPVTASQAGLHEQYPPYTSLDTAELAETLGLSMPPVRRTIRRLVPSAEPLPRGPA